MELHTTYQVYPGVQLQLTVHVDAMLRGASLPEGVLNINVQVKRGRVSLLDLCLNASMLRSLKYFIIELISYVKLQNSAMCMKIYCR